MPSIREAMSYSFVVDEASIALCTFHAFLRQAFDFLFGEKLSDGGGPGRAKERPGPRREVQPGREVAAGPISKKKERAKERLIPV